MTPGCGWQPGPCTMLLHRGRVRRVRAFALSSPCSHCSAAARPFPRAGLQRARRLPALEILPAAGFGSAFFFFAPHFLPLSVSLSTKDSVYFGAGNAAREGPTLISAKLRRKKVLRSRPPRRSALRGAGAAAAARARPQSVSLLRAGAVPRRVLRVPRRVLSSVPHRWGVLRACGAHRVPFPRLWVPGP